MENQTKPVSRFSTLNVFGKFTSKPPRPPPKDKWYSQGSKSVVSLAPSHALSMHTASIASSSHDTLHLQLPRTPISISAAHSQADLTRTMSPVSTHSHATMSSSLTSQSQASEMSPFRRGFSKLSSSFGRKPKIFMRSNASRTTFDSALTGDSEDGLPVEEDMSVSKPYNVQHHLHVDEGLSQIPPEWLEQLRKEGIRDIDILSIHSRRNRTTYLQHHPDISPESIRSRSDSPYSPSISSSVASSASPSSLSPHPPCSFPIPPLSIRRAGQQDDTSSVSTGTHSTNSDNQLNSPYLPSPSYSFNHRTSLSATSDLTDDGDPRTATASQFPSNTQAVPTQTTRRDSPQVESRYGDRPPRTPPSRADTATFRVVNSDPPSPPPAYGPLDRSNTVKGSYRDEKSGYLNSDTRKNETRSATLDSTIERHSEETVTPEVLLRGESAALHTPEVDGSLSAPPRFSVAVSQAPRITNPSPPSSPVSWAMPNPPRLSLHQDDLSDWTASLFSAMSTPSLGSLPESSTVATPSTSQCDSTAPIKTTEHLSVKKATVPPLLLTPPTNDITISVESDETGLTESGLQEASNPIRSTQLFNEVLSLVQFQSDRADSSPLASTYPYLPSPPIPSSVDSHFSSPKPFEFLNSSYESEQRRTSTVPSMTSSRDSQVTIGAESRWSRATTVRDVRDATIAHVQKTSVVNAVTVPAPVTVGNRANLQQTSTGTLRGTPLSTEDRPLSMTSSDGASATFPCAEDFPLPPPSPNDGGFTISSVQASPMSASFSTESDSLVTSLPYATDSLHSPASVRSSQSSSGSGSSSSSQAKPLSVTSGSDESALVRSSIPLHVELRYTGSESDGSILSPSESEAEEKWSNKEELKVGQISITTDLCEDRTSRFSEEVVSDGASAVVDWLVETPSPHYEMHGRVRRDSDAVYNPFREPTSAKKPLLAIPDANGTSPKFLSPSSASYIPTSARSPTPSSCSSSTSTSPLSRYRGWVSEVVEPLEEFIDHTVDPRELFSEMQEIAEGESGSVFSAVVVGRSLKKAGAKVQKVASGTVVAIKNVPLLPGGSQKLVDLRKELLLMSRITHTNILSMDALYVDLTDDALWIEMALMDRSLADILGLVDEGILLQEKVIARFASDIFSALVHLEDNGIAHRDVRSDNLLVNSQGVLKLTDFTQALLVDSQYPMFNEPVGVIYWQAPEMREGSYDARKVDVWSAGATVWEMAEAKPPFIDFDVEDHRSLPSCLPPLSQAEVYTQSFHDFLARCSSLSNSRPSAHELMTTPFLRSACARSGIIDILDQCRSTEERMHRRQSSDSQGTVLS